MQHAVSFRPRCCSTFIFFTNITFFLGFSFSRYSLTRGSSHSLFIIKLLVFAPFIVFNVSVMNFPVRVVT